MTIFCLYLCPPSVFVWMQFIIAKYFEKPKLDYSQFSCDIA